MNQKKEAVYDRHHKIAAAGVFTLLSVFPFFITNGYHNITASKYYFFCSSSAVFALLTVIAYSTRSHKDSLRSKHHKNAADIPMLLFLISCILSCLCSPRQHMAFFGSRARHLGLVLMISMILAYFFISRAYKIRYREIDLFGISIILMCFFSMSQYLGFDPFSLLSDIAVKKRIIFIGFLGNINVFASYLCISVPMFLYLFCVETNKNRKILSALAAGFGVCGICTANSDAGILGLAAALLIVFLFCCKSRDSFAGFWLLTSVCSFSLFLFWALTRLFQHQCRRANFMYSCLLNPKLILAAFCGSVLLFLLARRFSISEKVLKIIRNTVMIFSVLLILSFFAGIVYFSVFNKKAELGNLSEYLRFNPLWGSERGAVWQKLFRVYLKFPLLYKLIGSGEDTVAFILHKAYGASLKTTVDQSFDNAHNELLQYLVTLGCCGLVSYLMSVGKAVKSGIKSGSVIRQAASICVCVYLVQSLVTITQPITTPLLFVFLGLTQAES